MFYDPRFLDPAEALELWLWLKAVQLIETDLHRRVDDAARPRKRRPIIPHPCPDCGRSVVSACCDALCWDCSRQRKNEADRKRRARAKAAA